MPLSANPWSKLGDWSPASNTPTLPDSPSLTQGQYYECTDNGVFHNIQFMSGDFIYAENGSWQRFNNNEPVSLRVHQVQSIAETASNSATTAAAQVGLLSPPTVTTWATRPAAPPTGKRIIVTDVGIRSEFIWAGTAWRPVNGSVVLFNNTSSFISSTGAAEQIRQVVNIPAGLMAAGATLRITCAGLKSGTSETSTIRIRFGGSGSLSDPIHVAAGMATTVDNFGFIVDLKRITSTSLLRVGGGANTALNPLMFSNTSGGTAQPTNDMDFGNNFLLLTTQHSASAETTTIHSYTVELIS